MIIFCVGQHGISRMGQASKMSERVSNPRTFGVYSVKDAFSMGLNSPKAVVNDLTVVM